MDDTNKEANAIGAWMELEDHLDIAARWAIRHAFESWAEEGWEGLFPDVGQYDYERIIENAEQLLPADVDGTTFQSSYDWFADRAGEEDE